jgi:hypothetical protein
MPPGAWRIAGYWLSTPELYLFSFDPKGAAFDLLINTTAELLPSAGPRIPMQNV